MDVVRKGAPLWHPRSFALPEPAILTTSVAEGGAGPVSAPVQTGSSVEQAQRLGLDYQRLTAKERPADTLTELQELKLISETRGATPPL